MTFLVGALLLIVGMLFFNVGVDISMTPIGERVGTIITKSKNILIVVVITFIMGFVITISEPDLQVLAQQVPSIPNLTLILAVALGVGLFLVVAILRMLFGIPLSHLLLVFYGLVFVLTCFVPRDFLSIAFDSGGGISFIIPLSSIGGKKALQFLIEKEIIYIVTKSEQKNDIMQAIMTKAGTGTKAKAITFSLPVTDTAGLRLVED